MDSSNLSSDTVPKPQAPPSYDNLGFEPNENDKQRKVSEGGSSLQANFDDINEQEQKTSDKPLTIWKLNQEGNVEIGETPESGRDTWDSQYEFLFSCISMSVGLGNVWRFPFTAYNNGGGAFLIPYFVVLIVIGRPIYYLEMCVGQFSSCSHVKIWNMAPMFKGVGYGAVFGGFCVVTYYCAVMAQTVFYFFASFNKKLPWSWCNEEWGGDLCEDGRVAGNLTVSTSALYYSLEVNPSYPNINNGIGNPEWRLTLCLLFSWIAIFLSLVKGVKTSGKVAYFTGIFPYVVLLILLIRGVTLPGAGEGLKYLFEPDWGKLSDVKVWFEAVGQCFFSLTTGFGTITTFSSYNNFRHNVYRDAWVISFMDTFTSLLASCTVFSVLGYLSHETGVPIEEVAKTGGPGLAFVSYPEAIASFDFVPQLFAALFFLMLFTLGVGSATSLASCVTSIACDQFPSWKRWLVTLVTCIVGFLIGIMYVTPGGGFMSDLVDYFGANFVIYVMAMFEVGVVVYVYGLTNIIDDIEFMSGIRLGWYWKICWAVIPVALLAILIYQLATSGEFTSGGVAYPKIAIVFGWLIAAFAMGMIPAWGIQAVMSRKRSTYCEKIMQALKPNAHWGPKNSKNKREWEEFKKNKYQRAW